jgi:predicted MFS family arabinose efflux permease
MGVIYVTANTLAALGRNEEERGRAFAGVSAGVLSGITVGDGLGSIILTFGSYKVAYLAGAVCMLGGLLILLQCKDMKPKVEREESSIGFAKFMFNPRVLPFLILILLPFMILLSYREYFFPLYAEDNGMSEVSIGRLFLICGLIVIYVGPVLGEWLIQKMGSRRAMLLASILMVANIGIYMCYPSFVSAVAGVIILSVIISFAYTCQYAYFASIPECDRYGEGNAMGVYSMIENIGQTLGPIVFGFAISLGYVGGIRLVGAVAGGITLLYILIAITQRRKTG